MTLLRQEYRDEIFGALAARRIPVRHVLLHAEETILRERIAHREEPPALRGRDAAAGGAWAPRALPRALPWISAATPTWSTPPG